MTGGRKKKTVTPSYLAETEASLKKRCATLRALKRSMERQEIEELTVSGRKMMENGIDQIDDFIIYLRKELRES